VRSLDGIWITPWTRLEIHRNHNDVQGNQLNNTMMVIVTTQMTRPRRARASWALCSTAHSLRRLWIRTGATWISLGFSWERQGSRPSFTFNILNTLLKFHLSGPSLAYQSPSFSTSVPRNIVLLIREESCIDQMH
jgi:hypothetical protein